VAPWAASRVRRPAAPRRQRVQVGERHYHGDGQAREPDVL